jgi:serine/threonine-protein kinase RsbW
LETPERPTGTAADLAPAQHRRHPLPKRRRVTGGEASEPVVSASIDLDEAPCGYVVTDPGGVITHVNKHFLVSTGYRAEELVGQLRFQDLLARGHQIFYETHYSPLLLMQGAVREIAVDLLDALGERLPMLVNAVLDRNADGEPMQIRTTVFGATDRRRYEQELLVERQRAERSEARVRALQRIAAELAAAGTSTEVGNVLVEAALRLLNGERAGLWLIDRRQLAELSETDDAVRISNGLMQVAAINIAEFTDLDRLQVPDPDGFADNLVGPLLIDSLDWAKAEYPNIAVAMERAGVRTLVVVPLEAGKRRLGVLAAGSSEPRRLDEDDRELLHALGRQGGQAMQRAELHAEAARAAARSDFLASSGRALEELVGFGERAERLVQLAVQQLAEVASVELVEDETTRRLAQARALPNQDGQAVGVEPGSLVELVTRAVTGGRPKLLAERMPIARGGLRPANWWLALPLRVNGSSFGALVLGRHGRGFTVDDVAFCAEVAATGALALENARRYEQEREVAYTLQRSLLSGGLPRKQGLRIATLYRPAIADLEVGGDWYDAFELSDERIGIVVGDVVGRGLPAASAMGQIRSAIRALAGAGLGPAKLIEQLDHFVGQFGAGRMATLVYVELNPRSGHVRYACAGHFPPLLVQGDEQARYLWEGRSAPLDAHAGQPGRSEAEVKLQPGARLLLYTDGLVERRGRLIWRGLEMLREEMQARREASSTAIVNELSHAMLRDEASRDDVCLLAVSLADSTPFEEEIPADLGELSGLRNRLRSWLVEHDVDRHDGFAVVLAASEAVGNAIEHGYRHARPGRVAVSAAIVDERVDLIVSDDGRWQPRDTTADRGRGLMLMRRLMDEVTVDRGSGTTVSMSRRVKWVGP